MSIITTTKYANLLMGIATAGGTTTNIDMVAMGAMGIPTTIAIDFCNLLSVFGRTRMAIALCGAPYGDCL
jgi:hypothetical protein